MKWSDEPYVRLYTRETPNTLMLSWIARAVMHELMKKLDRSGQIVVTDDVTGVTSVDSETFQGVALLIRMPIDIVVTGVTELVTRRTFTFLDGVLCMPNFPEAQEAVRARTDAERAAAYRERVRAAKQGSPTDGASRPSRTSVTPSRFVPSALLPSSASSTSLAGGAGGHRTKSSGSTSSSGASPPNPTPKAMPIPEDWQPDPALCDELEIELDIITSGTIWKRCVRDFVDWHRQASGRASKSKDWRVKFRVWARKDRDDGKLEVRHRTMSETKAPTSSEPALIDASPEERKAAADAARAAVGLPKTGTTNT